MTKVLEQTITCAMCGKESEQQMVYSFNTFGETPYLDFYREGDMSTFVQECPHCHYTAPIISDNPYGVTEDMLTRREFGRILKEQEEEQIKRYQLAAYLCDQTNQDERVGIYYHRIAWMYWQLNEEKSALQYFEKALNKLLPFAFKGGDKIEFVCVDLYRRLGRFKECEELITKIGEVKDKNLSEILKLQKKLIKKGDTAPHKLEDHRVGARFLNLFKRRGPKVR